MQKIMMNCENRYANLLFLFQMDLRCANFLSNYDHVNVDLVFMSEFLQFIFTMVRHPIWILQFWFGPSCHLFIHSCTLCIRDSVESNITSRLWRFVAKNSKFFSSCVFEENEVLILRSCSEIEPNFTTYVRTLQIEENLRSQLGTYSHLFWSYFSIYLIFQFSEVFAIKLLTFHQENYSSMNESKLELLQNILAQNNINIHITFAILGLMVAIKNLENNSLLKISSVSGIIKSVWSAILALFLTTAIINSVEI